MPRTEVRFSPHLAPTMRDTLTLPSSPPMSNIAERQLTPAQLLNVRAELLTQQLLTQPQPSRQLRRLAERTREKRKHAAAQKAGRS